MSRSLTEEYLSVVEKDIDTHIASSVKVSDYILNSTAHSRENYVWTCYGPKIFTEEEFNYLCDINKTLYGIFDKIINRYFDDADYRELFGFDKRLEDLILRCDRRYLTIPIARIDIFYNEDTKEFKFCEFNTDGSSAMNEDRELGIAIKDTPAYASFAEKHKLRQCELFYSWIDELEAMYAERTGGEKLDNIVIADFLERAYIEEFGVFLEHFKEKGYNAEICEIRNLRYDGKALYTPTGMKVNAIYRRAVTGDIMKHYDEVTDFIEAVKDGNVMIFGDFFTQIVHNKVLYTIMWNDETLSMLSDAEQDFIKKHVPRTYTEREITRDMLLSDKDGWILKPKDSYGSRGIFPGISYSYEEWEDIVDNQVDYENYVFQEFFTPYRLDNYRILNGELIKGKFYNLTGVYVYNGKTQGIYSRAAKDPIISTQYNEVALATFIVEK